MVLEFRLSDWQKKVIEESFNLAKDSRYIKKSAERQLKREILEYQILSDKALLEFKSCYIAISKRILRELLRRAYLAVRIKKEQYNHFFSKGVRPKVVAFEIYSPVRIVVSKTILELAEAVKLSKKNVAALKDQIDGVLSDERKPMWGMDLGNNVVLYDYGIADKIVAQILSSNRDANSVLHTHPFTKFHQPTFSPEDILLMAVKTKAVCDFVLAVDMNLAIKKFNELYRSEGERIFDSKGYVGLEHIKKLAETLATECVTDNYLKERYKKGGMPLIMGYVYPPKVTVFTMLRISD